MSGVIKEHFYFGRHCIFLLLRFFLDHLGGRGQYIKFTMISFFIKTFFLILFLDLVYFKIYRMSAGPQQQTNEWCRISQLQTWISTIKLVKRYETANRPLRQGDEELKKRIKQKYIYIFLLAPEEGLFSNRTIGQFV